MAVLHYQGHGSFRITAEDGRVIYVDPYAGEGYHLPADLVLVTHEHGDHNVVSLITLKPGGRIVRAADLLRDGKHGELESHGVTVEAVHAYNKNHRADQCVGFVVGVDGVTLYAAGDTSETEQMGELASRRLDWALLPTDGHYNMGPEEASRCAEIIGAAHTIPIHTKPGELFDRSVAERVQCAGRVIVEPGGEISL